MDNPPSRYKIRVKKIIFSFCQCLLINILFNVLTNRHFQSLQFSIILYFYKIELIIVHVELKQKRIYFLKTWNENYRENFVKSKRNFHFLEMKFIDISKEYLVSFRTI